MYLVRATCDDNKMQETYLETSMNQRSKWKTKFLRLTLEQSHKVRLENILQREIYLLAIKEATMEYKAIRDERKNKPWVKQDKSLQSIVEEKNLMQASKGEATPRHLQAILKALVSNKKFDDLSVHHA